MASVNEKKNIFFIVFVLLKKYLSLITFLILIYPFLPFELYWNITLTLEIKVRFTYFSITIDWNWREWRGERISKTRDVIKTNKRFYVKWRQQGKLRFSQHKMFTFSSQAGFSEIKLSQVPFELPWTSWHSITLEQHVTFNLDIQPIISTFLWFNNPTGVVLVIRRGRCLPSLWLYDHKINLGKRGRLFGFRD